MGVTELSVIIVNYNTREMTSQCLQSIERFGEGVSLDIILIDNASSDDSVSWIEDHFPSVELIKNDKNLGFSRAVNQGIAISKSPYLLFLNSDVVIETPLFQPLLDLMKKSTDLGVLGGRLRYPDRRLQLSAWRFPNIFTEFFQRVFVFRLLSRFGWYRRALEKKYEGLHSVDWVTGAFMAIPRKILEEVGTFDEVFFMYYEDTDLCARIKKAGKGVFYDGRIEAIHYDAVSRKKVAGPISIEARKSQLFYYKKHLGLFQTSLLRFVVIAVTLFKLSLALLGPSTDSEKREKKERARAILKIMVEG